MEIITVAESKQSKIRTGCAIAASIGGILGFVLFIMYIVVIFKAVSPMFEKFQCYDNISDIVRALHRYQETHGALPPLYTVDEEGNPLHSWRVLILPFLWEQKRNDLLYQQIRLDEPWDSKHNQQFHRKMPRVYKCPSMPRRFNPSCSYSAIAGLSLTPATEAGSVIGLKYSDFAQGLNNTLALVEVKVPFCWMDPMADVTLEDLAQGNKVGSHHPGGSIVVALMDVGMISLSTTLEGLQETGRTGAPPKDVIEQRMALEKNR